MHRRYIVIEESYIYHEGLTGRSYFINSTDYDTRFIPQYWITSEKKLLRPITNTLCNRSADIKLYCNFDPIVLVCALIDVAVSKIEKC
jgi:hypothetical protein